MTRVSSGTPTPESDVLARRVAAPDSAVSHRRVGESDQCVDGDGAALAHDQWVEVDRGDIAALGRQAAQRAQQVDEQLSVDRRLTPKRSKHLLRGQPVDQRRSIGSVERCGGKDNLSLIHISEPTRPY